MPKSELRRLAQHVLHNVTMQDVERLETIFAKRTQAGWVIPDWLVLLAHTVKANYRR